jgi:hypothetical protein
VSIRTIAALTAILIGTTGLGACTYDYLQRSDRVAYHAGDAVKANLERETANPTSKRRYETKGLGKDGVVVQQPVAPVLSQP